jgi:hypothetical protein
MLFYHGPEYQKTSYATLNELTIGQDGPEKRNVNEVLADPNPQGKVATYKALPAVRGSNWKTTYQVDMVDKSAASSKATKGRTQTFTKQFDHGALFPQNNPCGNRFPHGSLPSLLERLPATEPGARTCAAPGSAMREDA